MLPILHNPHIKALALLGRHRYHATLCDHQSQNDLLFSSPIQHDVMTVLSRKEREFARREHDILDAALSLFTGPNWEQVTVEQISRQAEIGKGTVYKHFDCKEEIYARIAISFNRRLLDTFLELDTALPVIEILRRCIKLAFDIYLANPAPARVSFYCQRGDFTDRLNPELQQEFESIENRFNVFFGEILTHGIEQNVIPNRPIDHLMVGLQATFDGAISMIWNNDFCAQETLDEDTFIQLISEFMLAGLIGSKPKD